MISNLNRNISFIRARWSKIKGKEPSGKSRGGQPGHERNVRPLIPTEKCQEVIPVIPDHCKVCGCGLRGKDPDPVRHQVIEIPQISPIITEYQLHALVCPRCRTLTQGELPQEVKGIVGPRLQATIAILNGVYQLSLRQIQSFLQDFFGVSLSLGEVDSTRRQAGEIVAKPVEEVRREIQKERIVHADETGFRQGNADGKNQDLRKGWLWVAATSTLVAFSILLSRGQEAAEKVLGAIFEGILISDRCKAYNFLPPEQRGLCWSHLSRDFRRISEREGESGRIGTELLEWTYLLFHYWHRVRDGTLQWSSFQVYAGQIRQRMRALLEEGADYCPKPDEKSARAKTARTCRELLKVERAMWTFVRVQGVEPTNNLAERMLRPAGIWRKKSFGSQSAEGSEFVARMLTVVMTLRAQERNVLSYMTQACQAARRGEQLPSLLPDEMRAQHDILPSAA